MSGRKVVKRACDACKIRKIKCSEIAPCDGCVAAGIACTFVKHPATRGPRRLRKSTLQEISQIQQQWEDLAIPSPVGPVVHTDLNPESVFAPSKVAALVLQLCVYRLRCYPVWPIIKVERLVASLQKPQPDIEVFALAYAVAAATIAQIRATPSEQPGGVTAEMMEAQCLYAKARRNKDQPPDLTTVRIPFFLHIYYENLEPGGIRSITCLREAIAIAHMIGLHRESYYRNVEREEQEIRRRTLWLLFVAERGVSILHKLPVTIKTKIAFPSTDDTDEKEVLLAYQKLITMFWSFDQAGVFELLDGQDFDLSRVASHDTAQTEALAAFRSRLDHQPVETHGMNDIQAVDILVTRQWMRVIIWRLAESHGFFSHGVRSGSFSPNDPVLIAKDLLNTLSRFPNTAIEAHGPGLETKVFEIACSVADAITLQTSPPMLDEQASHSADIEVLSQLRKILSKNRQLDAMLTSKVRKNTQRQLSSRGSGSTTVQEGDRGLVDFDIEQELQAHGFDFTDPLVMEQSPGTESMSSDRIGGSPRDQISHTTSQQQVNYVPGGMLDSILRSPNQYQDSHGVFSHDQIQAGPDNLDQGISDMDFNFNTPSGHGLTAFESFADDWTSFQMSQQSSGPSTFANSAGHTWRSSDPQ